jgi:carboxyl-terminal processing protease
MEDNNFIHQDMQPQQTPLAPAPKLEERDIRPILMKRTVGTALISAAVTFILTISILIYGFYSVYLPTAESKTINTLAFDSEEQTLVALEKLKTVIQEVKDNYLEELTDAQILEAMTIGFPSGLDNPYTYYMSAKDYTSNLEAMSGEYVGIGCTVTMMEDLGVVVVEVITGGPAEAAGLLPGDVLVSVDGESIDTAESSSDVAARVKGLEGTTVKIEIYRPSTEKTLTLSIVRRTIQSHNVSHRMLDATTGYVMVKSFAEGVPEDFIAAMDDLQAQGATNIVFDLRNNSGGNAAVMIEMLEYLLPADTVLATIKGRESGEAFEINWKTEGGVKVPDTMRYAILVNEYSARASEFFSGCLRDYEKAQLIGKNTYGKGSGTKLYELSDGSAVNITMFKYYLPNGESIEGVGLVPDFEIDLDEEFKYTSLEKLTIEQDTQLSKAIEVLHETNP